MPRTADKFTQSAQARLRAGHDDRKKYPMQKLLAVALLVVTSPANAQDAVAIGEEVYEQHCQACHGEKLRSAGAIPDLRDLGANEREKFDTMVMEGRGQMPAWQGIVSPLELDQLWAYVRSRAR
jgi:mono/diheme cytochrome c family protein